MNKEKIIAAFLSHFTLEHEALLKSAKAAHEAATHEEAKSEDKHDTRATEASYLAHGQAMRVAEIENAIQELKHYHESSPQKLLRVQPGSIVTLECAGKTTYILFTREGGGTKTNVDGKTISLLTPHSPLGEELLGAQAGDEVSVETQGGIREYQILEIL